MEENPYEPPRTQERSQSFSWLRAIASGIGWVGWMLGAIEFVFGSIVIIVIVLGTLLYNIRLLLDWLL